MQEKFNKIAVAFIVGVVAALAFLAVVTAIQLLF